MRVFLEFNFAPPGLHRDIGILGLLHKRVLGLSHHIFQRLLPFCCDVPGSYRQGNHDKQLYNHLQEANFQMSLFCRSIFAMTYVYNRLPQETVDCHNVTLFQRCLTKVARKACNDGDPDWSDLFSCRI